VFSRFEGMLTGHGLDQAPVTVEMETVRMRGRALYDRGRFLWRGAHRFQAKEIYRLTLPDGRWRYIAITAASRSAPVVVEFATR
jgi:hypothetical protein